MENIISLVVLGMIFALSLGIAGVCLVRWKVRGFAPLGILHGLVGVWAISYLLRLLGPSLQTRLVWDSFTFLFSALGAGLLIFSFEYPVSEVRLPRWVLALLFLPSLLTLACALTDSQHSLLRLHPLLVQTGNGMALQYGLGVWFTVEVGVFVALSGLAVARLARILFSYAGFHRQSSLAVLVGAALPMIVFLFAGSEVHEKPSGYMTVLFLANGLLTWACGCRFLWRTWPFPDDFVVEQPADGVLLLDAQKRILEANPGALTILGTSENQLSGLPVGEALAGLPDVPAPARNPSARQMIWREWALGGQEYAVAFLPLYTRALHWPNPQLQPGGLASWLGQFWEKIGPEKKPAEPGEVRGWAIQLYRQAEGSLPRRELIENGQVARNLIENAQDGVVILDRGQIVYSNDQMAAMVGLPRGYIDDTSFREYLSFEFREEFKLNVLQARDERSIPRLFEANLVRKDGLAVPVEINFYTTSYRNTPALAGVVRDVSQRKRIEHEMRILNQRLSNFFSQAKDGIIQVDEYGVVIEWNQSMEEISGLPRSAALNRFFVDIMFGVMRPELKTSEMYERTREIFIAALQTGETNLLSLRTISLARPDGSRRTVELAVFPIRTPRGFQIGATVRDITTQFEIQTTFDRNMLYMQGALDNTDNMMWFKDLSGKYQAVNKAYCSANGRPVDEILGKTDYDLWPRATAESYQRSDQRVIESRQEMTYEEFQPVRDNVILVKTVKSPVFDRAGNLIGVAGQTVDLTQIRQVEALLKEGELRFRAMASSSPSMTWFSNAQGQFSFVNEKWCSFTGQSLEQEPGNGWETLVYPDDISLFTEILAGQHKDSPVVFRLRRSDGVYRWIQCSSAAIPAPDGRFVGLIGSCLDITDQRERERHTRSLALVVEQNPAGILLTDANGRAEYANCKYLQISCLPADRILGSVPEVLKPILDADDGDPARTALQAGREWQFERQDQCPGASHAWERVTLSTIAEESGEILHYLVILEDISAQKQAELALSQSRSRLEAIYNNSQIGIGVVDASGQYTQVNECYARMLGYSVAELLQMKNFDVTHPDDLESTRESFAALRTRKIEEFTLEKRYRRKDGSVFWGQLNSMLIYSADGELDCMVGFIENIDERKAVSERMRESEELYRSIVHASPDSIMITAIQGKIQMVSPSALRMFDYREAGELVSCNVKDFILDADRDKLEVFKLGILNFSNPGMLEARGKRRDGSVFTFEATAELVKGDDGLPKGLVFIFRDISDRKRLEAEQRRRVNELEALRATTSDLSAELELSRLLNAIVERVVGLLDAYEGEMALYDEEEGVLVEVVSFSRDRDYTGFKLQIGEGAMGIAAQTLKPLIIADYAEWEGRSPQFDPVHRSVIAIPLVVGEKLLGAITVGGHPVLRPFDERDARLVGLFAQQAAVAVRNAKLFSEVQRLAILDPLTGVYNRRYFFERALRELHRSQRYHSPLALLILDVDHFKAVNDRHGHLTGDEVLRAVARICRQALRDCDLVGRYGGEEFVILLPETGEEGAMASAKRLCQNVAAYHLDSEQGDIRVTVSIGVACLERADISLEEMLNQADQAMYRAKQAGRDQASR